MDRNVRAPVVDTDPGKDPKRRRIADSTEARRRRRQAQLRREELVRLLALRELETLRVARWPPCQGWRPAAPRKEQAKTSALRGGEPRTAAPVTLTDAVELRLSVLPDIAVDMGGLQGAPVRLPSLAMVRLVRSMAQQMTQSDDGKYSCTAEGKGVKATGAAAVGRWEGLSREEVVAVAVLCEEYTYKLLDRDR
jgi:hypothetical protein